MRTSVFLSCFLVGSLSSGIALGEACYVSNRSSSASIPEVEKDLCYEFVGMSEGDIDWSCSNENDQMINSQQRKVSHCETGSLASCEAAVTQETLANYRAAGQNREQARPAVPNDAKIITHYYRTENLKQLRIDCENVGGTWRAGK